MANPYSIELRERVVGAYEAGIGSYPEIAKIFNLGEATVKRWVWRYRAQGDVVPDKKGGGTESTICLDELVALVGRLRDANANEITAEYNRGRCKAELRHVSSIKRALHRAGFVVKKASQAVGAAPTRCYRKAKAVPRKNRIDSSRAVSFY